MGGPSKATMPFAQIWRGAIFATKAMISATANRSIGTNAQKRLITSESWSGCEIQKMDTKRSEPGAALKKTKELDDKKEQLMEEAQNLKYDQNDDLKDKLINLEGNLYEATLDMVFGAGLIILQKDRFGTEKQHGANKLGLMLIRKQDSYLV